MPGQWLQRVEGAAFRTDGLNDRAEKNVDVDANLVRHLVAVRTQSVQGYLAHKKQPPPRRVVIGPWVYSYYRVLVGRCFL